MSNNFLAMFKNHLCGLGVHTPTFTLISEFKRFLISEYSFEKLKADDLAIKLISRLEDIFDDVQTYFESAGVDCPYSRNEDTGSIQSFNHINYSTEIKWDEFKTIEKYIIEAEPKQLLLISGLALISDGNYMVVVNDGPNDGGVDLIAKNKNSDYNCQVVLAQVKKASSSIGKEMVIYEHANYWDQIIRKDILSQHLKKINVKEHSLALEVVYHFFTNNELSKSAISYARSRTIKIRYAREIAACLSKKYSAQEVVEWVANAISSEKFKTGTNLK